MIERCEACGAVPAPRNICTGIGTFRGHDICPGCYRNWRNKDKALGREATWEEFLKGTTPSFERRSPNKQQNEEIVKMDKEGKTSKELASMVGLSQRTIERILRDSLR